jgi:hypothetical protein
MQIENKKMKKKKKKRGLETRVITFYMGVRRVCLKNSSAR